LSGREAASKVVVDGKPAGCSPINPFCSMAPRLFTDFGRANRDKPGEIAHEIDELSFPTAILGS